MPRQHSHPVLALSLAMIIAIGGAAAVRAQTTNESQPAPSQQAQPQQTQPQQEDTQQPQQAAAAPATDTGSMPALPLGHDGVRQVQEQLIALGFDPGPADGEVGPATLGAAHQYNESRGGYGRVPVDAALLARLQQDQGPRLSPEQVAERSQQPQPRYSYPAANPLTGVLQQFEVNLRNMFNGGYGY